MFLWLFDNIFPMKTEPTLTFDDLQNQLKHHSIMIEGLSKLLSERDSTIHHLKEQLEWFKRQFFGKKSEKIIDNDPQIYLPGLEPGKVDASEMATSSTEDKKITLTRKLPERNGQDAVEVDPSLPIKTTVIDLKEEEKICKETGERLVEIGRDKSYKIAYQPGSYFVKEIIRLKYAHPKLAELGVKTANLPESLLTKCQADDSLLAHIITEKFVNHMPLYRLAEQMGRDGLEISRKLLSQWVIRAGMAVKPLYDVMVSSILASGVVFMDETTVKVQAKNKCDTGYVWVLAGGRSASPPYRIYNFRSNRCHKNAWDILKDYRGILHSDKYGAYQSLAEKKIITWCPCMAHARRKFFEAQAGDPIFRAWVLRKIKYLFMLEKVAWARSPQERLKIRQQYEVPILDELAACMQKRITEGVLLPKSKLREAIGYYLGLIPYLKNYTTDAFARLDNNVAERAIRPLTIGRKNWIFFGSEDGGQAATILLSLVQTCRGLDINPTEYLEDVFRRLMSHSANKLEELLPDRWLAAKQAAL